MVTSVREEQAFECTNKLRVREKLSNKNGRRIDAARLAKQKEALFERLLINQRIPREDPFFYRVCSSIDRRRRKQTPTFLVHDRADDSKFPLAPVVLAEASRRGCDASMKVAAVLRFRGKNLELQRRGTCSYKRCSKTEM